jgi:predicted amidohydrolase YtcJ
LTADITAGAADVVLLNGRVWTGLPEQDGAEFTAVALRGNRILAVGSAADVMAVADQGARRIDLGGRRVIPGLIDSHLHAIRAGLTYGDEVDWSGTATLDEALSSVRRAAGDRPAGAWIIVGGGWHPSQLDVRRMPTRAELDRVAPRHPVFVYPLYARADRAVVNGAALDALGWRDGMPDPPGGVLYRDGDGALTGTLTGIGLYQTISAVALRPSPERQQASTRAFFTRLAALGLTGVLDAGGMGMAPEKYRAVYDVWRRGELPIRVRSLHGAVTPGNELAEVADWQRYLHPGAGDSLLAVLGLGEAVHYGCHDWEALEPFVIAESSWHELVEIAERCAAAGWPLTIHAILDESVSRVLDAFEIVDKRYPVAPLRFSLCHVECIGPENLERVRRLGIGLALQGRMAQKSAAAAGAWGAATLRHAPPFGDIRRLGIPFGAGTDGTRSASYNPWRTIWWMVTGQVTDGGPPRAAEHRLSRAEALRAYTSGSAWFSFEEEQRGRLVPGMLADLAVLTEDVLTVPPDAIASIAAELTIVDGRVVHACGDLGHVPVERHGHAAAPADAAGGGR